MRSDRNYRGVLVLVVVGLSGLGWGEVAMGIASPLAESPPAQPDIDFRLWDIRFFGPADTPLWDSPFRTEDLCDNCPFLPLFGSGGSEFQGDYGLVGPLLGGPVWPPPRSPTSPGGPGGPPSPPPPSDPRPPDPPPGSGSSGLSGVYLHSGEFCLAAVDLCIAGRGLDFLWARKYRSRIGPDTAMGNGWDFSYRLFIEQSGMDLVLHDGNSREDTYVFNPMTNKWEADEFFREFTFDPNPPPFGTYTLTFADKGVWRFLPLDGSPQQGKIVESSDRNGNTMVFDYDVMGRLVTIHDTLDTAGHTRDITIAYNPDGFIESVTDFSGRSVTYEYYDGIMPGGNFGDLKSVTTPAVVGTPHGNDFPAGKTTVYTYSTGSPDSNLNGNLLTVTDPKGQVFLTLEYATTLNPLDPNYDAVDRAIFGDPTDIIDFVYAELIPDPGNNFSTFKATVNDRVGNVSEHFYDADNRLVMLREYIGRADPTMPTDIDIGVNPPLNPLRADDALCDPGAMFPAFETRIQWNADALPTLVEYPNGNSVQCVYEIDLDPMASQRESCNLREIHFNAGPLGGDQATISHLFEYEPGFGSRPGPFAGMVDDPFFFDVPAEIQYRKSLAGSGVQHARQSTSSSLGMARVDFSGGVQDPFKVFTLGVRSDVVFEGEPLRLKVEVSDPGCDDKALCVHMDWSDDDGGHADLTRRLNSATGLLQSVSRRLASIRISFVTSWTDGRGNQTQHSYDANGNRIQTIHRIPTIIEDFEYNAFGQLTLHRLPDNGSGSRREDVFTYYDPGVGCMNGYLHDRILNAGGFDLMTTYEYDCVGNVTLITDPKGNDSLYEYNSLNQPVRTQSRQVTGGGTRYEGLIFYDANDNVVRIDIENKDEAGLLQPNTHLSTIYEYDILNYVTRSCSETGNAALGPADLDCTAMPPAESLTIEFAYDANRNLTIVRFGEATNGSQPNNTVRFLYDERDLLFQRTRAPTDAAQSTTQYDYDCNGNLRAVRQGLEGPSSVPPSSIRVAEYFYDGMNRLTRSVDPMGNVREFHFDANDNVGGDSAPAVPNPFGFRCMGEIPDVLGGAGNVRLYETQYFYDSMDRLTVQRTEFFDPQTQLPLTDGQSITQFQWTDNSQVMLVTDDNGNQTMLTYDTANRRSLAVDAKGNSMAYVYDANSNVVSITETEKSDLLNPDEVFTTTYAYDNLDRRTLITDNVGNANSCGYDSRSNRTVTTDALGNETRHAYDGINRLMQTIFDLDGDGADGDGTDIVTTQSWDDSSRLISQADDNGNMTTNVYDSLNRITSVQYADCTDKSHSYDVHHNRLTTTDANGSVSTNTFDRLNRLSTRSIVVGPGVSVDTTFEDYQYDGLSRLVRAEDDDSIVIREYDSLSNRTVEQSTIDPGGTPTVGTVTCTHDGVGNRLACVYPGGRTITCTYDALNRVKTIADGVGTIATYDYIGPARVERRDYGNGTRVDDTYDGIPPNPPGDFGVKRIVGTTHTVIAGGAIIDDRSYAWNPMQIKIKRQDERIGGPLLAHEYVYDSLYRLTRTTVTDPAPSTVRDTTYDLDGVGNRTSVGGNLDIGPYGMDPALCEPGDLQLNQYTSTPFDTRQYDANGNLISFGCKLGDLNGDDALTFADAPILVAVLLGNTFPPCGADVNGDGKEDGRDIQAFTDRVLGAAPPARQFALQYDFRNRMVEFLDVASQQRHTYAYDALSRRIERVQDADGAADETRYFYDGFQVVEEQDDAAATQATYVYGGTYIDEVLNMQRGGGDFYYHTDDIYSVMGVTDAAGAVVERYEYGDYGEPQITALSQSADLSCAGASDEDGFPEEGNIVYLLADDFSFAQPTRITGIRWWGAYSLNPAMPPADDFSIRIFADDGPGGAPGTLLREEKVGDVGQVATGRIMACVSLTEYAYELRLTRAVEIPAAVVRWIGIHNNTVGDGNTWGWELSSDGNGTVAEQIDGGPWSLDFSTDLAFELMTDTSAIGSPYLFTGRRYDPETGLYYYRTRYLDPRAGRFTTRDSIGIWGDANNLGNGYAYVGNRPTCAVDPYGMQVIFGITLLPGQGMGWATPGGGAIIVSWWPRTGFTWVAVPAPWQQNVLMPQGPKQMAGLCVDQSCELITRDGPRRLADVQIGDTVLTPDGEFRKVIDKDFGRVWAQRLDDYVKITAGEFSIVLTRDHIIGGKPAGEWLDGDMMTLRGGERVAVTVTNATSTISGDLRVEGDADYVVRGGFQVGSMMSRYRLSAMHVEATAE